MVQHSVVAHKWGASATSGIMNGDSGGAGASVTIVDFFLLLSDRRRQCRFYTESESLLSGSFYLVFMLLLPTARRVFMRVFTFYPPSPFRIFSCFIFFCVYLVVLFSVFTFSLDVLFSLFLLAGFVYVMIFFLSFGLACLLSYFLSCCLLPPRGGLVLTQISAHC